MPSPTNACYRNLAKDMILSNFSDGLDGDSIAESWLRESEQVMIFTAGLGFDHSWLVSIYDTHKAAGTRPAFHITVANGKRPRGRPKKVTSA